MIEKNPYLSIAMSSRNDGYPPNLIRRLTFVINSIVTLLERYRIESEVILVEYNPPEDQAKFREILKMPAKTQYCTVRNVIVPHDLHVKYSGSFQLPFAPILAQNIGLRRSRGDFVLLMTSDCFLPKRFYEIVAEKKFKSGVVYRTDRVEVMEEVVSLNRDEDVWDFCKKNATWVSTRRGAIPFLRYKKNYRSEQLTYSDNRPCLSDIRNLHFSGGDFTMMSRETWFSLGGWREGDLFGNAGEVMLYTNAYLDGNIEIVLPEPCCIYHIAHESSWRCNNMPDIITKLLFYLLPFFVARKLRVLWIKIAEIMKGTAKEEKTKQEKIGTKFFSNKETLEIMSNMLNRQKLNIYRNGDCWGLKDQNLEEHILTNLNNNNL